MPLSKKLEVLFKKFLPRPFTIAVLLTLFTLILAFTLTNLNTERNKALLILTYWEEGLWNPPLLVFAIQMMLMLVLGHVLALSSPVKKIIRKMVLLCNNTAIAAATITFCTIFVSLINWGLGLIFGAIFARKFAEHASENNIKINYPLIGAAGYSGLMTWHGGISGSAPIKIAEKNHFLSEKMGVIPQSETVFSSMNIAISIALLIILPSIMYYIGKKNNGKKISIQAKKEYYKKSISGAEKIDESKKIAFIFGGIILFTAFCKSFIIAEEVSLKIINPDFINLVLFGLAIIMHQNFNKFLKAVENAITGASGILIQFPLYFGIMGVISSSGMIESLSSFFVNISNETTFPLYTFFSAAIVNIFVPSGGGQWAIQGPIIIEAANQINVSVSKCVMALAYGDQITNMLQPFWALPLLGITGLKAKEILPYTLILFLIGSIIFITGIMIF